MDKILTKQAGIEYLHEVTSVFQPFQLVSTQHLELFRVVSAQNFPEALPCCSWCVEMTSPGIPCSFLASPAWLGKHSHDASVKGFVGICQHNLKPLYPTLTESSSTANHPKNQSFASNLCVVYVSLSYISESQFFLGRVWSNGCFTPLSPPQGLSALPPLHPQKFVTFRIGFFVETWQKHENTMLWVCVPI